MSDIYLQAAQDIDFDTDRNCYHAIIREAARQDCPWSGRNGCSQHINNFCDIFGRMDSEEAFTRVIALLFMQEIYNDQNVSNQDSQ